MRIIDVFILLSHHLLYYHRHLLLLDLIVDGADITPGSLRIDGGIDKFDGVSQLLQPDFDIGIAVGQQVGLKDAGKRLHEGVLKKPRGPDSQWLGYLLQNYLQLFYQLLRQLPLNEQLFDGFVIGLGIDLVPQFVVVEKILKLVRADNECPRCLDIYARHIIGYVKVVYQRMNKGQPPTLATQRTRRELDDIALLKYQSLIELDDLALVLFVLELLDNLYQVVPQRLRVFEITGLLRGYLPGQLYLPAGGEPQGKVISACMVQKGLRRNILQLLLKLIHVPGCPYGTPRLILVYEIPEPQVVADEVSYVLGKSI